MAEMKPYVKISYGLVWRGLTWYGLVWFGMIWYGLVWFGMVWYGLSDDMTLRFYTHGKNYVCS